MMLLCFIGWRQPESPIDEVPRDGVEMWLPVEGINFSSRV